MIKAILIGGIHHNMLGVIRALGEKKIGKDNIHILIVGDESCKNIIACSRYINRNNIIYPELFMSTRTKHSGCKKGLIKSSFQHRSRYLP